MKTCFLLIAHAPLASALRECALHVFPDCAHDILALDVQADHAPEDSLATAQQLLSQHGSAPVLVLSDMLGATPCNVAQRLIDGTRTRLVVGMNLPMVLRAISYRAEPLDTLVMRALTGASQAVMQVLPSDGAPSAN